jgi:hypothetical protein
MPAHPRAEDGTNDEHSSLIIDSTSITAAAECGPENHWTCAIAAAVFLFPNPAKPEPNRIR